MRTITRLLSAAFLGALAAACATPSGPGAEGQDDAARAAAEAERDDPWAIMIDAERYSYLITLAHEGAIEGPPAMTMPEPTEMERATRALHYAARELYMLRDRVCATGLVGRESCGELPPPDWFGEPPDAVADIAEVRRRIDWLTSVMAPFVAAGCDAGQSRQEHEFPHYCSVE